MRKEKQMSLLQITVTCKEQVVEITLAGVLRADTVEQFTQELEKIATLEAKAPCALPARPDGIP